MQKLKMIEDELVPVYETSTGERVVYGTELHSVLEVKSNYRDWIRNRLNDCEALENEDYESFAKNLAKGRPSIEHIIKLDTAKEMAMLERNERGKQVRRYFIEVEKKYKAQGRPVPTGKELLAMAVLEAQNIIAEQSRQIEEMKPKVEFFDAVADSATALSMNEVAKVLGIQGFGRNKLFEFLREHKILDRYNVPYQRYVDCGWFRVIEQKYMRNGEPVVSTKTLVYQKGIDAIRRKVENCDWQ